MESIFEHLATCSCAGFIIESISKHLIVRGINFKKKMPHTHRSIRSESVMTHIGVHITCIIIIIIIIIILSLLLLGCMSWIVMRSIVYVFLSSKCCCVPAFALRIGLDHDVVQGCELHAKIRDKIKHPGHGI